MKLRSAWFFLSVWMTLCLPGSGQDDGVTPPVPPLSIGAYYYPWYHAAPPDEIGWMAQALRGRLQPGQLPQLGVYESQDPKVIGGHIAQSLQAGLDFWAVSWWGPGKREDQALRHHILTHPDAGKLKYAILYESTGRLGSMQDPHYKNLVADFTYLRENLFDHPYYLKIEGKPVVFIYLTRVYFRDRGHDALAQLRAEFPNLYLIGDDVFGEHYDQRYARQWNAITAYDVYGQSLQRDGATQAAIQRLREHYENAREIAHEVGTAFVPGIAPGYNDRAVRKGHPGRARTFSDKTGSKEGDIFRSMIKEVALPLADPLANRTIMITSFNEWYEDTQIEATTGTLGSTSADDSDTRTYYTQGDLYQDYGNLYLDILHEETRAYRPAQVGGPALPEAVEKEQAAFKVIGYLPSWSGTVAEIPFQRLTHINYSFLQPNPDGSLGELPDPPKLRDLVERAHANNVKVGLAIGGWNEGDDSAFETLASAAESRERFVNDTMKIVADYGLDGVDMDWEYPDAGDSAARFLLLMQDLSRPLRQAGKYLSAAVVSHGAQGEGIVQEVFPLIDMLNIMAYDGTDHGLYTQAQESIQYWSKRGCPQKKLILGLPFYGRSPYQAYRDLVAANEDAPSKDLLGTIRYNGVDTIKKKTELAWEQCGGVMIWELSQDVSGENSLLRAISEVITAKAR